MQDPTATGLPELGGPFEKLVAGAVILAIALALAPLAVWIAGRIAGRRERVPAGWNLAHAGATVAVFIGLNLAVYLLTLLGLLDFGRAAPSADSGAKSTGVDPLFALGVSVAVMGLTAAFVASCATQTTPDALGALGLRLRGLVRALGAALFLAPVAYLVLIGLALVWPLALNAIGIEDVVQPVARMLVDVPREQRAVAAIAGIAVIPFFEELIFRGFLQPALERHVRPWLAIFLTSLAFGAMHGVAAVVPIAGLSLVLGYARQRTGSVWAAFALHAVNNSLAFYLLWFGPASPAA